MEGLGGSTTTTTTTTYCNNLLQQPTTTTYYNNLLQLLRKGWVGRAGAGRRGSGAGIPGGGGFNRERLVEMPASCWPDRAARHTHARAYVATGIPPVVFNGGMGNPAHTYAARARLKNFLLPFVNPMSRVTPVALATQYR